MPSSPPLHTQGILGTERLNDNLSTSLSQQVTVLGLKELSSQPLPWTDALLLLLWMSPDRAPVLLAETNTPSSGRKRVFIPGVLHLTGVSLTLLQQRDWKLNNRQRGRPSGTPLHKPVSGAGAAQCQVTESVHKVWQKPLLPLNCHSWEAKFQSWGSPAFPSP